ncbi:Pimeloyl-ACP methyl ester carboxylesterase [Nannocystis exedens]|uniref:Pimeloyl-ACP methyl ester carboxylesterase n=1 Tax=Nannocystis exedens TaxID=54 RepID=A0A1I1ZSA0_9BACT|nr:alpha/beta hydrolase [Nannocystis exedens]PCC75387.1 alpha/beta hydrolase [Nannocystis exedens]SFE33513.1 Pimeloyl-ACP methyl ester carboxylesterase [Nannocystis exedens]
MPQLHADRAVTSYRHAGSGPALLLLHAGASSGVQWERAIAALAPRWSVAAPDLYGHGQTPCPEDMTPETLLARQVAVLLALLDVLGGPARVVGHSYGAVLALSLAATAPERVRDLVLVEPVAFGLLAPGDPALAPVEAVEAECRALVLAGDSAAATRRFLDFWSDPELWDFLPEADRLAIVAGARERHFIGGPAVFGAPFAAADLARITCPVRLVIGDDGPAAPRAVAERLAASLPQVEPITVPGAGHMLPLTHHRAFLRLVEAMP